MITDDSRTGTIAVFGVANGELVTPVIVAAAARASLAAGWIPGRGRGEVHVPAPVMTRIG